VELLGLVDVLLHLGPVPGLVGAGVECRPVVVLARVATAPEEAVDGSRATEELATGPALLTLPADGCETVWYCQSVGMFGRVSELMYE
jgi:hypothetical protein